MRIYSLAVVLSPPGSTSTILSTAQDLSSFSFYQRPTIQEFLTFFTRTVAERVPAGQRQSLQENNYTFHVYNKGGPENLAAVLVTDLEYPVRPAFSVLNKTLESFTSKIPQSSYSNPATINFPEIKTSLSQYQDPRQADALMRVQAELDETKIVLHKTIESVLARGEKLEDLVVRSDMLSAQSKKFYTTAKKQNSCCVVM